MAKASKAPAEPTTAERLARAGFAFIAPADGSAEPDPVQAAMDAAVSEHNERQRRALAAVVAKGAKR